MPRNAGRSAARDGAGRRSATVEAIATACHVSVRRVQQLVAEGVLPRATRGAYDRDACTAAYVRYLQRSLASRAGDGTDGDADGAGATPTDAPRGATGRRAELLRVQTEIKQLELAKARGQLMAISDHESFISSMIIEAKARIMAIAPRVAPRVLGMTSRLMAQATIEAEIKVALSELARTTATVGSEGANDAAASAIGQGSVATESRPAGRRRDRHRTAKDAAAGGSAS